MSLVIDGHDLGGTLDALDALADLARHGVEYPQLFALIDADEPAQLPPDYLAAIRTQAKVALEAHGSDLKPETNAFLDRLVRTEDR